LLELIMVYMFSGMTVLIISANRDYLEVIKVSAIVLL